MNRLLKTVIKQKLVQNFRSNFDQTFHLNLLNFEKKFLNIDYAIFTQNTKYEPTYNNNNL